MLRKLYAFFAYIIYSGAIVWIFVYNTAYQFDSDMVARLEHTGFDTPPNQWGWGNHYIWRLLAAIVATWAGGLLAGAIARTKAGLTAVASNIPSVLVWIGMIYFLGVQDVHTSYGDQEISSHTGMVVISVIAIPLTIFLAFLSGEIGAKVQRDEFGEHGVLGIAGYHWAWLVLPIYLYGIACLVPITSFLRFSFLYSDENFMSGLVNFILFLTALASFIPIWWVYSRLRAPAQSLNQSLKCAGVNFLILCIGYFVVGGIQLGSHWLLGKLG